MWSGSYGPASNTAGYRLHKCQQYPAKIKKVLVKNENEKNNLFYAFSRNSIGDCLLV
jgi:hypothetical protein